MLRVALIVTQVFMAELLAAQATGENREDLHEILMRCIRNITELLSSVTGASFEPVIRIVALPFGRTLGELKRIAALVGEEGSIDEIMRQSAELLRVEV